MNRTDTNLHYSRAYYILVEGVEQTGNTIHAYCVRWSWVLWGKIQSREEGQVLCLGSAWGRQENLYGCHSKDHEEWWEYSGFFVMTCRNRDKVHTNKPGSLKANHHFQGMRNTFGEHLHFFFSLSTFPNNLWELIFFFPFNSALVEFLCQLLAGTGPNAVLTRCEIFSSWSFVYVRILWSA